MSVSAKDVKELRQETGAGIMDCKEALKEKDGDPEAAAQYLREKGIEAAKQKSGKAAEGLVGTYLHMGGNIGVLVEINCETDFVANTDQFEQLVEEVSMQIAAQNPSYVSKEDVPSDVLESEKNIIKEQMSGELEDKPEHVQEQIMEGKLDKQFYQQEVLLEQPYIRESDQTVGELVEETIAEVDENVRIRRFVRYEVGEGIETEEEDFAREVAEEIG
ncbi:MAG: translation elongation factor Ts [bacterium]